MIDVPAVMKAIAQLRRVFEEHFENRWFYLLFEDVPFDPLVLRDIHDFLWADQQWQITYHRVNKGLEDLDLFIRTVRNYLLPFVKEKLHISYLRPDTFVRDKDQLTVRRLVAAVLPANLAQLEMYVRQLRAVVAEESEDEAAVSLDVL